MEGNGVNEKKKEGIDIICKNCGYEKGVHSMLNYYCPADDPYKPMPSGHEFNIDSYYEQEKNK